MPQDAAALFKDDEDIEMANIKSHHSQPGQVQKLHVPPHQNQRAYLMPTIIMMMMMMMNSQHKFPLTKSLSSQRWLR